MKAALLCIASVALFMLAWEARAQHGAHPAPPKPAEGSGSRRVTMEELHRSGGVPRGWTFKLPAGDASRGRQVFADFECYKCHTVQGAGFPEQGASRQPGPELSAMGAHHPAEYFAESILDANAVIVEGPGFVGPDGRSIMPSYADTLSVTQLLDVVAYLRSLGSPRDHPASHDGGTRAPVREQSAGDYTLQLVYAPATGGRHDEHAHHHGGATSPAAAAGHLMLFVADRESREPVPYLPVTAAVHAAGAPPRTVRLVPMVSERGFHYGTNLRLPDRTQKVVVSIGPTTMQVMAGAKGRFTRPISVVFPW